MDAVVVARNGAIIREVALPEDGGGPALFIGRAELNDLVLLSPRVSKRHASIQRRGARVFITDLGSTNGTHVNEVQVPPYRETEVFDGDVVELGPFVLRCRLASKRPAEGAPAARPVEAAWPAPARGRGALADAAGDLLTISHRGRVLEAFGLDEGELRIGRDPTDHVRLATPGPPVTIVRLARQAPAFYAVRVEPAGAAVLLNGRSIASGAIGPGDVLAVDGYEFRCAPGFGQATGAGDGGDGVPGDRTLRTPVPGAFAVGVPVEPDSDAWSAALAESLGAMPALRGDPTERFPRVRAPAPPAAPAPRPAAPPPAPAPSAAPPAPPGGPAPAQDLEPGSGAWRAAISAGWQSLSSPEVQALPQPGPAPPPPPPVVPRAPPYLQLEPVRPAAPAAEPPAPRVPPLPPPAPAGAAPPPPEIAEELTESQELAADLWDVAAPARKRRPPPSPYTPALLAAGAAILAAAAILRGMGWL